MSVCLSVCLFGFGGQTTGVISTKFGMDLPLDPVAPLEYFFKVDPPGGDNFGKAQKSKLPPFGQDGGRNPLAAPFVAFLRNFLFF